MKIILQNRNKKIKINMLLIFVMSMLTISCSSDNDEEGQTPDIEIPSEETPQEKILGTWKINIYYNEEEYPEDIRTYTFFDDGFYAYCSQEWYGGEGMYSISNRTIILDGKKATLDVFTNNVVDFFLEEYRYNGKRIIKSDSELRAENKRKLVGTWLCEISYSYGILTSQLTLKKDGTYINNYGDDDMYIGRYHLSEDKIYFEEPMGKDPLCFYEIKKLTNSLFYLEEVDGEDYVSAKKE